MEKLRIKFKKHYKVCTDADNEKCICRITLKLPLDEEGKIHELLRDSDYILCGTRLSAEWGSWGRESYSPGEKSIYLSSPTWEELEEKVDQKIDGFTEDFRRIKEENESLLKKTPQNETVVVVI